MAIANLKVQALVTRIDKLEKQNRRFKQLAFAALVLPALLLLVLLSSVAAPAQAPTHQASAPEPASAATRAEENYKILLQSFVAHGTMTQEQADAEFQIWLLNVKKGTVVAMVYNPDPVKRQKLIDELKSGNLPKELAGLDQAFLNKAWVVAQEVDADLTARAETQNLNVALNKMYGAFNAPNSVYKDDYNAQSVALHNPEFLRSIGVVTTDSATGKQIPNWEMAGELDLFVADDAAIHSGSTRDQSAAMAALKVAELQRDVHLVRTDLDLLESYVDDLKKFRDDICSSFKMSDKPDSCLAF